MYQWVVYSLGEIPRVALSGFCRLGFLLGALVTLALIYTEAFKCNNTTKDFLKSTFSQFVFTALSPGAQAELSVKQLVPANRLFCRS